MSRDVVGHILTKTAEISDCGLYRYRLTRRWANGEVLTFVMLNPSTADALIDDPTIRRCMGFAKREGAGGIRVVNLLAFRATRPKALHAATDPYGPGNFSVLGEELIGGGPVICAWGAHFIAGPAGNEFVGRARAAGKRLHCLGRSKDGHPRHPLYVRADQPLEPFA